jgi:hypothetical protein
MKNSLLLLVLSALFLPQVVVAASSIGEQEVFSRAMQAALSVRSVQRFLDWMADAVLGKPQCDMPQAPRGVESQNTSLSQPKIVRNADAFSSDSSESWDTL